MYETAKETLMYGTVLWTLWEREWVGLCTFTDEGKGSNPWLGNLDSVSYVVQ